MPACRCVDARLSLRRCPPAAASMPASRCVDACQPLLHVRLSLRPCLPTVAPCPPATAPCPPATAPCLPATAPCPPAATSMPASRCSLPAGHCSLSASHSSLSASHSVPVRQPLLPARRPLSPCPPATASLSASHSVPVRQPLFPVRQPLLPARRPQLPVRRPQLPVRRPLFPVRRPQLPARQLPARPPRFSPLLSLLLVFCGCCLRRLRPAALSSLSLCRFSRSPPRLCQLFRLSSNTPSARLCSCDRPPLLSCRLRTLAGHAFGRRRGRGRVARVWLRQP